MFDRFSEYISARNLFEKGQKILLAVSGGIDSMVMLYLFEKSGFDFGVVHCNFQLRGAESDEDEEFVRQQVLIHGIPAWFKKFETEEYAQLNGISIEMAARELRYTWFSEVRKEQGYDFVATAHHADDQIETFFLNLSRKTGIKGLTGIREKTGEIIRPLLFASRIEIEKFAHENLIEYREDSTNSESVYQRNFIRNKILPAFGSMNPAFRKNMTESIENLKEAEAIYNNFCNREKSKIVEKTHQTIVIDIKKLMQSEFPKTLLVEILSEFGFNPVVIGGIFRNLDSESGLQFFSKTHRLVKDREKLFITENKEPVHQLFYIEAEDIELFEPKHLLISHLQAENFKLRKETQFACVDAGKLEFPLLIRKWQEGDYFQPFGMTGFKKLSDYFIDEKIPVYQKENTWLLCSGEKIVWVMGMRIDNRFRIDQSTRSVLQIEIRD